MFINSIAVIFKYIAAARRRHVMNYLIMLETRTTILFQFYLTFIKKNDNFAHQTAQ